MGVLATVSKPIRAIRAMRGQMRSTGRPPVARRDDRVRFWKAIARGVSSEDAAKETGGPSPNARLTPLRFAPGCRQRKHQTRCWLTKTCTSSPNVGGT